MIKNMIKGYAANLNDKEYIELKKEVLKVIDIEDKKRGFKNAK